MSVDAHPALDYSWLHDDLEEDLVGAEWHQGAIRALATSLKTLAEARHWPWHVGDQVTLVAWKPDNSAWRPAPDIRDLPTARARGTPGNQRTLRKDRRPSSSKW